MSHYGYSNSLQYPESTHSSIPLSDYPSYDNGSTAIHARGPSSDQDVLLTSSSRSDMPQDLTKRRRRPSGWRVGAMTAASTAVLALLINIIVASWAASKFGFHGGIATVFTGDCRKVETMNTWIHLAINALSTALLSGSNYCMQCVCAPTRAEVDRAHAKRKWLDIGVPSLRNLRNISWKKVILWWCLGLSSIPLHLMYNSAFFSTLATYDYNVVFASENFTTGASYDKKMFPDVSHFSMADLQARSKTFDRLENTECIRTYATDFINSHRNLVIIVDDPTAKGVAKGSSIGGVYLYDYIGEDAVSGSTYDPYSWICPPGLIPSNNYDDRIYCNNIIESQVIPKADQWNPNGWKSKYCLSEPVTGKCSLSFSLVVIVIVIIFNIGKALSMLWVAFRITDHPLITVGDAISSFLNKKDATTRGICMVTKDDIKSQSLLWKPDIFAVPLEYRPKRRRWFWSASKARWLITLLLFSFALIAIIALEVYGTSELKSAKKDIKSLWSLGLGAVHPQSLISGWALPSGGTSAIIPSVLVANVPQPILSFLYLLFNGLCTSMLLAHEWSGFFDERKTLRVSNPRGTQRSTYFLQLPYRYAGPLLIFSGVLHWLVSQSIFLANVSTYFPDGSLHESNAISTCGYSPIAMMFVLIVGGLLIVFVVSLGARRMNPGMQLAGSCSAAISAACHQPPDDDGAADLPVMWGKLPKDMMKEGQIGHCCFSSFSVEKPVPGELYAGLPTDDDEVQTKSIFPERFKQN
ncbi:MAG: hypothetical protein M1812_006492 [Candelaria pacifica]|nr:MAG: hypothetical protein M1812_006492 [Candelaria pacifica]